MISGPFDEYLNNLSDSRQWAGQLELEALSLIYGYVNSEQVSEIQMKIEKCR